MPLHVFLNLPLNYLSPLHLPCVSSYWPCKSAICSIVLDILVCPLLSDTVFVKNRAASTACFVVTNPYQVRAQLLYSYLLHMLVKPQDKMSKYNAFRHTTTGQIVSQELA